MARLGVYIAAALALGSTALARLLNCGPAQYDPTQYVCHDKQFLCPITNGEPLSYCNGACYSTFMYTCQRGALQLRAVHAGAYTLTASNPAVPALDGQPVSACGQHWWVGGPTCAYCPDAVGASCPPGNVTAMAGSAGMAVLVPGGQLFYLGPDALVGYTQAHSAYVPPGSRIGGLVPYDGGGLVDMNEGARGWAACPSTASGGGDGRWTLWARNTTNAASIGEFCRGVNLRVVPFKGDVAAWQYT